MSTNKFAGFIALCVFGSAAFAQPGDRAQIDIKARVKGTTAWLDVVDHSAANADTPVDVEVGVFFYRDVGTGFSTAMFAVMTSNWLPGDHATLLDRADSAKHPDGRQGNFNFGGQNQAAYTTGIDAERLRIAASGNPNNLIGGGVSVKQNTPVALGSAFETSDGVFGFSFEMTIVNPTPGQVASRALVCDAPRDRINSYSVYGENCDFFCIFSRLLPTDVATINIRWPKCSSACPTDFNCDGFSTGDDFDGFVAAFVEGENDADFDGNGFVNGDDFDAYVTAFEAGC